MNGVEDNDFLTMLDTCTSFILLNNLYIKRKYGRFSDVIIHYLCSKWKQSFPRVEYSNALHINCEGMRSAQLWSEKRED